VGSTPPPSFALAQSVTNVVQRICDTQVIDHFAVNEAIKSLSRASLEIRCLTAVVPEDRMGAFLFTVLSICATFLFLIVSALR
jgi:hypothetical protein